MAGARATGSAGSADERARQGSQIRSSATQDLVLLLEELDPLVRFTQRATPREAYDVDASLEHMKFFDDMVDRDQTVYALDEEVPI